MQRFVRRLAVLTAVSVLAVTQAAAQPMPAPVIAYAGAEAYVANGLDWVRFTIPVVNRADYDPALFEASPTLPPCGINTSASRTWVDIWNADTNTRIYGFCALDAPESLALIWYAAAPGGPRAVRVYVTLWDRLLNVTVQSNVLTVNTAPTANAGADAVIAAPGVAVALDGSASADPEFDPMDFAWALVQTPPGSAAALSDPGAVSPSFLADVAGTYVARLIVSDPWDASAPDDVVVTVQGAPAPDAAVQGALDALAALDPGAFKNGNMKHALAAKLGEVLRMIEAGDYAEALAKLENDVLQKTDGCAVASAPDRNDWLRDCAAQAALYPQIQQAIEILRTLL